MPEPAGDPVHSRLTGVAFPLAATRTSPRFRLRGSGVAVAAAVVAAVTLRAQAPVTDAEVPIAPGAVRQPQLELQGGQPEGGDARSIRVYRVRAPLEWLFKYYLRRFGGARDAELDTASVRPGDATPMSYHLTFHSFEDQCADSAAGAAAPGAPAACKVWRRGKDKKRALGGRIGYEPEIWIERATLSWFSRDAQGGLVRWRLELGDAGLSADWKQYRLGTLLTVERVLLGGKAQ